MIHRVGIIGGGPKGLYGFERLVAQLRHTPLDHPVEIHLFNRSKKIGAGEVYDPAQPPYLLLNFSARSVDMWTDDGPPSVAPESLCFVDWCDRQQLTIDPDGYPPRALVGRYLSEGFESIVRHLPTGVEVHQHRREVVDIRRVGRGYRLSWASPDGSVTESRLGFDKLLLTTGHPRRRPASEIEPLVKFAARRRGTSFIPFVYPVERNLASIPAGRTVGMKGMTLTFIDAALALTEGRGGRFERHSSGRLFYLRSGREPEKIVAFSSSGLPPAPKAIDAGRYVHHLHYTTDQRLSDLRDRKPEHRLDFTSDIWPLIELDMAVAFYQIDMRGTAFEQRLALQAADPQALEQLIADYHARHPMARRLDIARLLDPVSSRQFIDRTDCRRFMLSYLRDELAKARLGDARCADKAALDVWRTARPVWMPYADFDGLTPDSHRRLHKQIWPLMKRLVFGPPIENMEKILALGEAGILDLGTGPGAEVAGCAHRRGFVIRSHRVATGETRVDVLVDARMPKPCCSADPSPLMQSLQRRGLARPHESRGRATMPYRTGALDISVGDCFAVGKDRRANPDITVMGIPTEGLLFGNESLSRKKNNYAGRWARNVIAQLSLREHLGEDAA